MKQFRAVVAFGNYSKGALLQPTGIYRDTLVRKGYIAEVTDEPIPAVPVELDNREIPSAALSRRRKGV
jgi:hypothetical protein